ncbi:tetratricopeptide repeat protein [Streptomyces cavourensis]|uniref:Tetratricopeptide repeat protein n=1 Tax=Streptomyces cavourensis TaxID=67258 RepID=A0ABY5F7X5_9ACTN|nr:tetratricopeptide repeat protein [Streptomyces cavourensis]UTR79777.1 tetratricopeptide repeat protein [Streptomyces cavourensis]
MQTKALAPEYQGALTKMSVNASLTDVLAEGVRHLKQAELSGSQEEVARTGLAVAEAHRRLGQVEEADRAWKASYRAARSAGATGAMAWALWSGGTLARQRGSLRLAFRLLGLAAELGKQGGDVVARGYSLAGLAETGRIQGDYETVATLHEQLLSEARARGEARHTVWALEGIAQIHRNTGRLDSALAMFEEAASLAGGADDRRGRAWALRGIADIVSLRDGGTERALALLSEAEVTCREMKLSSALAYNHKMRANVLFRAGRYEEAREVYEQALGEFRAMTEPRGEALAALGLVKARARLGRDRADTAADLDELRGRLSRIGLLNAREMVERAYAELGVERTGDNGDGGPAPAASDAPGTSGLPAPAPAAAAHEEVPVR